ncbi:MAG: N-6 DNA methylase [Urechidicola sp.]|nr:N-6 DNA methylase [Urechidicola sp.]
MANEKKTDFFIGKLLDLAKIKFTPNGSDIKEIQDALKTASKKGTGKVGFPEFTAKSKDFIIVIEDKADIEKQADYKDDEKTELNIKTKSITDYAENGALHYANEIIKKTSFKKVFAFGCSGDEKHHIIRPIFVDEKGYKLLHPVENFENFFESNIEKYHSEQVLEETPTETLELEDIIKKSSELHEYLRNYGQLGDSEKPLVVSAILLALREQSFDINSLTGDDLKTDGQKIYDALSTHMTRVKVKPETKKEQVLSQFNVVKDRTTLNQVDERLAKTPLKYFAEFLQKNVYATIAENSPEDVLGRFYGEFIRYSGGDGQTLGVVLTPSHITELFCDLVDIKPTDTVFDPCCGTGGFLITAMNKMLEQAKPDEKEIIKAEKIHGIEIREDMFSIATTNMIFRGDGKSNLIKNDFLKRKTEKIRENNYSVGFMNPPYSQGKGKDTAHLSEINFIKRLLDGLADGGRCVVIVPQSTMVGNKKEDKQTKKRILDNHTLEGVITLNKETFYGVGTNPCIAVFTAHKPHSEEKHCKFINFENDGFEVNKHVGLVETERAKERKAHLINCWLHDAPAESKFMVKTTISGEDEWLHSFYYFNDEIPKEEDFEKAIANYLSFEFNMIAQGKDYLFKNINEIKKTKKDVPLSTKMWEEFFLSDIFPEIQRGKRLKTDDHKLGKMPYVSSTAMNNGVDNFISNKEKVRIFSNCLSIANSGSVGACFYQPFEFVASDHVTKLKNEKFNKNIMLFISTIISRLGEKYSFNREINDKRIKREKILLPINKNKEPDYDFMGNYMKRLELDRLKQYLNYKEKK